MTLTPGRAGEVAFMKVPYSKKWLKTAARTKRTTQMKSPVRIRSSIGKLLFVVVEVEEEFAFEDRKGESFESPSPPHDWKPSSGVFVVDEERAWNSPPILCSDRGMLFARHAFERPDLGILPAHHHPPPDFPAGRAVVRDA